MKVLVSDKLSPKGVSVFEKAEGITVDVKTGLAPEELRSIIGEYDGLVVRSSTKVTADPMLKYLFFGSITGNKDAPMES